MVYITYCVFKNSHDVKRRFDADDI